MNATGTARRGSREDTLRATDFSPPRASEVKRAEKAAVAQDFLDSAGVERRIAEFPANETIFSRGDVCRDVMYIQRGIVKISVVSKHGKKAVVAMLQPGDFVGEGALTGQPERIATATAVTPATLPVISREVAYQCVHE